MVDTVGVARSRSYRLLFVGILALAIGLAVRPGAGQSGSNEPWRAAAFSSDPKALLRAALALPVAEGTDVLVLSDEHSFVYEEDGRRTSTRRQVYRVISAAGAEAWADVTYEWQPWHQERPLIRARVITKDGAVHNLDPKTLSESEVGRQQDKIFSDRRTLSGPLPAVAPGSIVEEEAVIRDKAPFFDRGEVVRIPFGRSMPVRQTLLSIDAPPSLPLHYEVHLVPGLQPKRTESRGRVRLLFEQGPLEANVDPPDFLPAEEHRYPNVTFSTGLSWQAVASRYAEQVEAQLRGADPRTLLGEVPAGAKPGADTVGALVARLHAQVRYTGVEFGQAALVPRPPAEVLQRKYGDCKDKAALLVAMLRAAGRPANLALLLTAPSHDIDPGLPGMGRFDHAIVYLPGNPPVWIDATDDYARAGTLPPAAQGRLALVVAPETTELVRTAESKAQDNRTTETREFFLSDMGPARVIETTDVTGTVESSYRSAYVDADTKENRDVLTRYAQQIYLTKEAPKIVFSDAHDFTRPYRLRLEIAQANRGFTDMAESLVAVPVTDLVNRLPRELRNEEAKAAEGEAKEKPKPPRSVDWLLEEASLAEWNYRIHPPVGFRASSLPKPATIRMGPASLSREFKEEEDGSVTATLRFDMGSRRFTPAQAEELRKAILALGQEDVLAVRFAHRGFALLEAGNTREALVEFRAQASANAASAAPHVRMARGLLAAGLGEAAREEACAATAADPKSALAWKILGWIMQHNALGRRFGKGFDYEGAWAAYRKAVELDPEDHEAQADLAILLEHNAAGDRYAADAHLDLAIEAYLAIKEEIKETELANNLAIAYLRAKRLPECQEWLKAMPAAQKRRMYQLMVSAMAEGAPAAIKQATKEFPDEAARRTALRTVASELIQMREYAVGGEILASAARGADNAAQILGQAELFSRIKRYEDMTLSPDDPKTAVKRFFALLLSPNPSRGEFASVMGRMVAEELDDPDAEQRRIELTAGMRSSFLNTGLPLSVGRDILVNNMEMSQEGDSATGFRMRLQLPAASLSVLVMREDGVYRVIDLLSAPSAVGRVILSLVERNDLEAARKFLDWVREEVTPAGGDDPYAGRAFPRLWQQGQNGDREAMRVAAASLITEAKHSRQAIEILKAARPKMSGEAAGSAVDMALAAAYLASEDFENLLRTTSGLLRSAPKSATAFLMTVRAQVQLKRWDEAAATIAARLKILPDDPIAMRSEAEMAEWQDRFDKAVGGLQHLAALSRAGAGDWNNLAWDELFLETLPAEAAAHAQKAASLSQNNDPSILLTLAAVLAVSRRAGEARSLMLQILGMRGLEEPDSSIWLLYGLIAEQYGEKEVAATAFRKIQGKKAGERSPNSSFELAQRRLKRLASAQSAARQQPAYPRNSRPAPPRI